MKEEYSPAEQAGHWEHVLNDNLYKMTMGKYIDQLIEAQTRAICAASKPEEFWRIKGGLTILNFLKAEPNRIILNAEVMRKKKLNASDLERQLFSETNR